MRIIALLFALAFPASVTAQVTPKPLFAADEPIRITIQGPINQIVRKAARSVAPQAATLSLAGPSETHTIRLSARGLSRRTAGICQFPPLRVEFAQPPAATSLFAGQRRLKLVTHCRASDNFQQYLLKEYATYLMFNVINPLSHRVRLATVDYAEPNGKISITRWGFFIEDLDDLARRNGFTEIRAPDRISSTQLDPVQAARVALFQYMIGNLDWSMIAGPAGEGCCHNSQLIGGPGKPYIPIAYDFDYTGLVDAPYAVPPESIRVDSVRDRVFRGYCRHSRETLQAAADFRAKRAAIDGVPGQVPGMSEATQRRMRAYLSRFFDDIATDDTVRSKVLKGCLG